MPALFAGRVPATPAPAGPRSAVARRLGRPDATGRRRTNPDAGGDFEAGFEDRAARRRWRAL
jgi:hypothetical protein